MKNWKNIFILILITFSTPILIAQVCETPFDLRSWSMEGTPNAYWKVLSPTEVIDTTWLFPATFFVSSNEMINVIIRGKVTVTRDNDNDFIGLVFGYKNPTVLDEDNTYNFYLFDWKSEKEKSVAGSETEGFRLSYYDGYFVRAKQQDYFVANVNNPPYRTLIDYKFGTDLGWEPLQEYELELRYTDNLIQVSVDSTLIFEHTGCFPKGRFGFYCMSQAYALFKDFTYEQFVNFTTSKDQACINEDINFYPYNPECGSIPGFVDSLKWNFGDGLTSNELLPIHSYDSNGNFEIQLIAYKNSNCIDTLVKNITIRPDPIVDLGDDIDLPACSSVTLEAANPGANYLWSTGHMTESIELINIPTDTTVWVEVEKYGCTGSDTVLIRVEEIQYQLYFPNAFTPNNDGNNDSFAPVGNTNDVASYKLSIFNRWGQTIFESTNPDIGWDGTNNGSTSDLGTYVYKVAYRMENCSGSQDYSDLTTITLIK